MDRLNELLNKYKANIERDTNDPANISISPSNDTPAQAFSIYCNPDSSAPAEPISNISTLGFISDERDDSEVNKDFFYDFAKNILEGNIQYYIINQKILGIFSYDVVKMTIGNSKSPLISNWKCSEQSKIKKQLKNGKYSPAPYTLK